MAEDDREALTICIRSDSSPSEAPVDCTPNEEFVQTLLRDLRDHQLPENASVTLTEGSAWLAFGGSAKPEAWRHLLSQLQLREYRARRLLELSGPSGYAAYGVPGRLELGAGEREQLKRAAGWWHERTKLVKLELHEAAMRIVARASREGSLVGRQQDAPDLSQLPVHEQHKPLRFDGGRNCLAFDSTRASALGSSFSASDALAWTDLFVVTKLVREMSLGTAPDSPPPTRIRGHAEADKPLVEEMKRIIEEEKCSPHAAAMRVVHKAVGGGTPDSMARRLVRRMSRDRDQS